VVRLQKAQVEEIVCIFSFVWFVYVAVSPGPTHYIFHKPMA